MNILVSLFTNGWIGAIATAIIMVASGFYINRSAKSEAEKAAKRAYEGAIRAMKAHTDALQLRIEDTETENKRLRKIMEEIFILLKARDIHVIIDGHEVRIQEGKEATETHIDKEEEDHASK